MRNAAGWIGALGVVVALVGFVRAQRAARGPEHRVARRPPVPELGWLFLPVVVLVLLALARR